LRGFDAGGTALRAVGSAEDVRSQTRERCSGALVIWRPSPIRTPAEGRRATSRTPSSPQILISGLTLNAEKSAYFHCICRHVAAIHSGTRLAHTRA